MASTHPVPICKHTFRWKEFWKFPPWLCPSLLSIRWAFFTVHITLHLLNRHFAVFWRYLCPFSLTRKCKRAGTMGLISFIFQNAKPEFGALEMHPWGVFQAREYTQLNPWVPLWTIEMCKLGIFIYASTIRCVFLPHILQAASWKPSAVVKTARQPGSFQQ